MSTPTPSPLIWTSDAVAAIRALREEEGRPDAAFRVDFTQPGRVDGDDVVFEAAPDVHIAIQEDGLPMIAGGVLDYESSHRGRGFRLANPAAKSACGCGQAFYADFSDQEPAAAAEMAD